MSGGHGQRDAAVDELAQARCQQRLVAAVGLEEAVGVQRHLRIKGDAAAQCLHPGDVRGGQPGELLGSTDVSWYMRRLNEHLTRRARGSADCYGLCRLKSCSCRFSRGSSTPGQLHQMQGTDKRQQR